MKDLLLLSLASILSATPNQQYGGNIYGPSGYEENQYPSHSYGYDTNEYVKNNYGYDNRGYDNNKGHGSYGDYADNYGNRGYDYGQYQGYDNQQEYGHQGYGQHRSYDNEYQGYGPHQNYDNGYSQHHSYDKQYQGYGNDHGYGAKGYGQDAIYGGQQQSNYNQQGYYSPSNYQKTAYRGSPSFQPPAAVSTLPVASQGSGSSNSGAAHAPSTPATQTTPKPAECVAIDSASACAPWNTGYYINITSLQGVYNQSSLDASSWNTAVVKATSGGSDQANYWQTWSGCSGYDGSPIAYARSYICLTDIFLFSSGCNTQPPPAPGFCGNVCDSYGSSLGRLLANTTACPPSQEPNISSRRNALQNAATGCRSVLSMWSNRIQTNIESCQSPQTNGVAFDVNTCGLGSASAASAFCNQNQGQPCCQQVTRSAAQQLTEGVNSPSSTGLSGITSGAIAVVAVLAVAALAGGLLVYKKKRSNQLPIAQGVVKGEKSNPMSVRTEASKDIKTVTSAYVADMSDEIALRVGDVVEVYERFSDGWGKGKNVTTGQIGVFPLACLN